MRRIDESADSILTLVDQTQLVGNRLGCYEGIFWFLLFSPLNRLPSGG